MKLWARDQGAELVAGGAVHRPWRKDLVGRQNFFHDDPLVGSEQRDHQNRDVDLGTGAEERDLVSQAQHAEQGEQPAPDLSHPAMAVNLDACIQCNRCVRACREEQVNDVIGYALRGEHSKIVFDLDDPMGDSTCVACGECVQACPTGALMPKSHIGSQQVDRKVDSVCPFCGVGCLITYNVKDEKIVSVDGRDGPANHSQIGRASCRERVL